MKNISQNGFKRELSFYKIIGVMHFKNFLIAMEKIVHARRDHKKNNYYLKCVNVKAASAFKRYLFYNAKVHVFCIVLAAVYTVVMFMMHKQNLWSILILILYVIVNLYCILIQRCNYIRITVSEEMHRRHIENSSAKHSPAVTAYIRKHFNKGEIGSQQRLVNDMMDCLNSGNTLFLGIGDTEALRGIAAVAKNIPVFKGIVFNRSKTADCNSAIKDVLGICRKDSLPIYLNDRRKSDPAYQPCIVTADKEQEEFFEKLFPDDSENKAALILAILKKAYDAAGGDVT